MSEFIDRLRSDENQEQEPDGVSDSFELLQRHSQRLADADKDSIGAIERHAEEIHDIYEDIDESEVSEREAALMYAYGQLALWVMDSTGSAEQRRDDLLRRIQSADDSG